MTNPIKVFNVSVSIDRHSFILLCVVEAVFFNSSPYLLVHVKIKFKIEGHKINQKKSNGSFSLISTFTPVVAVKPM